MLTSEREVLSIAKRRAIYGLLVLGLLCMFSASLPMVTSPVRAASSAAPTASTLPDSIGRIRSSANGLLVIAEPLYICVNLGGGKCSTGLEYMLRARASTLNDWDFWVIRKDSSTGYYTIKCVANGRYVSAELGYTGSYYGMLRARATAVGPWELFRINVISSPNLYNYVLSIQSVANGRYVSAELGYSTGGTFPTYGMLRARATAVGPWELFKFGRIIYT